MLSNFQVNGRALVQILLLGQPEFRDKLAGPGLEQLRQRVIATHHLDAMGADEVESYVRHRLTRVDWQGNPDFDASAFEAIHRYSGGIPRRVNQLCHRLMLHAALENAELVGAGAVEAVAADMGADNEAPAPTRETRDEKVLPLRSTRLSTVPFAEPEPRPLAQDPELARRIAALEARAEEHEAMLRRVLILLVDWVETDSHRPAFRTHAA
jgi:hypothetical protein